MKGRKPSSVSTGAMPVSKMPRAPQWLSPDARAEWQRVVPSLVERRVLDTADMGNLENYCHAQGVVRQIARQIGASGDLDLKLLRTQNAAMATARQLAALFGLTPVDRSRPAIRDGADDDELGFLE